MKRARLLAYVVNDSVEDYDICDAAGLRFGVVVVEGRAYTISVPAEHETITTACKAEGWRIP